MLFREVLGHNDLKERLIRTVSEERIHHAQMFVGPPGSGKLALALAYARYISCQQRGESEACGSCPSCLKYDKLAHPDLHFVYPVMTNKQVSKNPVSDHFIDSWRKAIGENPYLSENQWYEAIGAENKQGYISRQESSEILQKLSLKSYESEYKIMIIWLPEKMNRSSANTLLKMIEEPPPKTLFLMVAENTEIILPTILSRAQMIRVPPLDEESVRQGLMNLFPDDPGLVDDVVRRASGNFSTARQLLENEEMDRLHFDQFTDFMRKCYKREIIALNDWVESISGLGRERIKLFLAYGLRMVRENFILHLEQPQITYLTRREADFSANFSAFIHPGNAGEIATEFQEAIRHIEANGYPRIILMDLSVKTILLLKRPA